jgi:cysteine desulfurase family protein (TIGR01976 family)
MLDVEALRTQFPALATGQVYLDGPAGTQVPWSVIGAISGALSLSMSNLGGSFASSQRSEHLVAQARSSAADLVGGGEDQVVFGANMTSLTFALSRALAETWGEGDRVVVSALDHDANITPWVRAAASRGVAVDFVDFDPETTLPDLDHLEALLTSSTRLVAITACSNAFGTLVDVARVAAAARRAGALSYVDAVHLAPHRRIDVGAIGCDFLVCSSYKFFGPHLGLLWGRSEHLERLPAFKVRPAPEQGPSRWETGTPPLELLAGFTAAVDYLASLGGGLPRREALDTGYAAIAEYEAGLGARFLAGIPAGIRLVGMPGMDQRVPTFALDCPGLTPTEVAASLGRKGIAIWAGHHYALEPMQRLGFPGGLSRVGLVHLTTPAEVDTVLEGLAALGL